MDKTWRWVKWVNYDTFKSTVSYEWLWKWLKVPIPFSAVIFIGVKTHLIFKSTIKLCTFAFRFTIRHCTKLMGTTTSKSNLLFFFYRADSSVVLVTTIIYVYIAKLLRVASLYVALYTSPAFLLMRTESNGSSGVFFLFLQTKCSVKEKSLSKAVQSSGWNL